MTKSLYLPGADRTSKWFAPLFDGRIFTGLEKQLLHSTETPKTSGCPGYDSGKKAPTFTINPWPGYQRTWQHFPINESARALVNPTSTTVSENKDNVCQWEIIGYSDKGYGVPRGCYLPDLPADGIDYLARALAFVCREWDTPNEWASPWPMYPASYGNSPARMTSTEYDRFRGFLGHLHASGNSHGDPSLNIAALKARVAIHLGGTGGVTAPTSYRLGDRGDGVKALQTRLNVHGATLTVDGSYGPATEAAVKAFQRAQQITIDGIAGPMTLVALGQSPAEITAPPTPGKEPAMVLVQVENTPEVFISDGFRRRHVPNPAALADLQRAIRDQGGTGKVTPLKTVAALDTFGPLDPPTPTATPEV